MEKLFIWATANARHTKIPVINQTRTNGRQAHRPVLNFQPFETRGDQRVRAHTSENCTINVHARGKKKHTQRKRNAKTGQWHTTEIVQMSDRDPGEQGRRGAERGNDNKHKIVRFRSAALDGANSRGLCFSSLPLPVHDRMWNASRGHNHESNVNHFRDISTSL